MARSNNAVHSHTNHLEWRDAILLYYIMRSQGDQERVTSKEPWHIYASPKESTIFPASSLDCYLLARESLL